MPSIQTDGIHLHYRDEGDRRRPTIVLVHSILFGTEIFDDLATELGRDFRLIRADVHGHGLSGHRVPLDIDGMTEDFHRLLRHLDVGPVVWVGYSVGGMIGMRLAIAHPEAMDRLALIATSASAEPPELAQASAGLWQLFAAGHREDVVDAALQFFFSPATYRDQPALVARHRARVVAIGDASGIVAAAQAATSRDDVTAQLGAIRVPTLVVAGRDDISAAGPAEAERIAAAIPDAQLAIVEEANHMLALERPREFVDVVSTFVRAQPERIASMR